MGSPGAEMHALAARLMPLHRAQTGEGVRETLRILSENVPLAIREVPSGTPVLDWTVPREWNLREAFVADAEGRRVIDVRRSTLHLVNGSAPVQRTMRWAELRAHLHTLPERPDVVPYITGFFRDAWGFCLSQNEFATLAARGEDAIYDVVIDATVADGSLTLGEWVIPGETTDEVLLWTHCCHPALANDNLSGLVVAERLARWLRERSDRRYTYRIAVGPATIGAIAWLALNESVLPRVRHGLVLSLLGDEGPFTYKASRSGAAIDRVAARAMRASGEAHELRPFQPWGYDERQFQSPGFDLPMGRLTRTPDGEFPQYHTSDDDLSLVTPAGLEGSFRMLCRIVERLEEAVFLCNARPRGEPMLGRHGLYESLPPEGDRRTFQQAVQWVLNLADGAHSLEDIEERSGLAHGVVREAATRLEDCRLLERV